jgi:hypothetical protein
MRGRKLDLTNGGKFRSGPKIDQPVFALTSRFAGHGLYSYRGQCFNPAD